MNYLSHGNDHDFFDKEHVERFLRNHKTGTDNHGRQYLGYLLRQYENPSVLDIACGSCVNHETWRNMGIPHRYTGLDLTQKLLDEASKRYPDSVTLLRGYAQDAASIFTNEKFDVVVIRHFLEHVYNGQYESIVEQAFQLANKELIIVFFLTPHGGMEDKVEERSSGIDGHPEVTHFWNEYSWPKFVNFIAKFGCRVTTECIVTPGAAHTDFIVRVIK